MRTDLAVQHIQALDQQRVARYEQYFNTLTPTTQDEVFRRWLFAYASVHTSWKYNVILYNELKDLTWLGDHAELLKRIERSRAGLHNNRAKFIHAFSMFFHDHPGWFMRSPWETWFSYRDRLMEHTPGLGIAKTSFALELVHFHETGIVCFDTHQLQLYGLSPKDISTGKPSDKMVRDMERHWVDTCRLFGVSPVTARWIHFDQKQRRPDSRYWSHVLDGQPFQPEAIAA
jgi:thermostable 8-oxoguanine DNA glycosylase